MLQLTNKIAFITGGASGIGEATARLFAKQQAKVIIADIDTAKGNQIVQEIIEVKGHAQFIHLDVTSEEAWIDTITKIETQYNQLDILVNNAGSGIRGMIADFSFAQWRKVMAINLDSVFLGTKYALPLLQQSKTASIVNVSSAYGLVGNSASSALCASKGGVRLFTKASALEFAQLPNPIRVNSVCPGVVRTPVWEQAYWWQDFVKEMGGVEEAWQAIATKMSPLPRCALPIEIAQGILFLASDASSYMTGSDLVIDGGLVAQ